VALAHHPALLKEFDAESGQSLIDMLTIHPLAKRLAGRKQRLDLIIKSLNQG